MRLRHASCSSGAALTCLRRTRGSKFVCELLASTKGDWASFKRLPAIALCLLRLASDSIQTSRSELGCRQINAGKRLSCCPNASSLALSLNWRRLDLSAQGNPRTHFGLHHLCGFRGLRSCSADSGGSRFVTSACFSDGHRGEFDIVIGDNGPTVRNRWRFRVHLGCSDGQLTAALKASEGFILCAVTLTSLLCPLSFPPRGRQRRTVAAGMRFALAVFRRSNAPRRIYHEDATFCRIGLVGYRAPYRSRTAGVRRNAGHRRTMGIPARRGKHLGINSAQFFVASTKRYRLLGNRVPKSRRRAIQIPRRFDRIQRSLSRTDFSIRFVYLAIPGCRRESSRNDLEQAEKLRDCR